MAKEIAALQTTEAVGRSFFCFFYYFEKENGIKDLLELLLIFFLRFTIDYIDQRYVKN
jgi:hypothetical protein